jgi:hypothetical protein
VNAHRIEVVSAELVAERGTRRVSWRVRRGDGWVLANDWPGAIEERLDPGPGTVWETRLELELPTGAVLERIESRPAAPERKDALEYLTRETRSTAREVVRTRYRVSARGELLRA